MADDKMQTRLCERIAELEKENAKLKEQNKDLCESLDIMNNRENELLDQIEQLSNDNHVLKTSFITQQAQIEKMKCCENCKWYKKIMIV